MLLDINDTNNADHWSKGTPFPYCLSPFTFLSFFHFPPISSYGFPLPMSCLVFLPPAALFSSPPSKDRNKGCFYTSWASRMERGSKGKKDQNESSRKRKGAKSLVDGRVKPHRENGAVTGTLWERKPKKSLKVMVCKGKCGWERDTDACMQRRFTDFSHINSVGYLCVWYQQDHASTQNLLQAANNKICQEQHKHTLLYCTYAPHSFTLNIHLS